MAEQRNEMDLLLMPGVEQVLSHLAAKARCWVWPPATWRPLAGSRLNRRVCASGFALADSAITFLFAQN